MSFGAKDNSIFSIGLCMWTNWNVELDTDWLLGLKHINNQITKMLTLSLSRKLWTKFILSIWHILMITSNSHKQTLKMSHQFYCDNNVLNCVFTVLLLYEKDLRAASIVLSDVVARLFTYKCPSVCVSEGEWWAYFDGCDVSIKSHCSPNASYLMQRLH